jgi:hypothetical protein
LVVQKVVRIKKEGEGLVITEDGLRINNLDFFCFGIYIKIVT